MSLQLIKDDLGRNTGVYIPMNDWELLVQKHSDLREMIPGEPAAKKKLSDLAGKLSHETALDMLQYVKTSRGEWEGRIK